MCVYIDIEREICALCTYTHTYTYIHALTILLSLLSSLVVSPSVSLLLSSSSSLSLSRPLGFLGLCWPQDYLGHLWTACRALQTSKSVKSLEHTLEYLWILGHVLETYRILGKSLENTWKYRIPEIPGNPVKCESQTNKSKTSEASHACALSELYAQSPN